MVASRQEHSYRALLDVVAHAGRLALGATQVVVAVAEGTDEGADGPVEATVLGWHGVQPPALHGRRLVLASHIPVGVVTAVHLDLRPDGSLAVSAPGRASDDDDAGASAGRGVARALRGGVVEGLEVAVLVEGARAAAGEGLSRSVRMLLDGAQDAVSAERGSQRQRLRAGLEEREEERRRWARELHDETLQQLGALQVLLTSTLHGLGTSAGNRDVVPVALGQAIAMVSGQISGLRHLITELRPAALDELGLSAPLHALARRTEELTGLEVEVEVSLGYSDGQLSTRLLPDIEVAVYRVVQEALTNASRHSGATRARIWVRESDTQIRVEVSDNGAGIAQRSGGAGFGLAGMRERAALAGGRLEVLAGTAASSGSGGGCGGTTIRLVVPAVHRAEQPTGTTGGRAEGSGRAEQPHT